MPHSKNESMRSQRYNSQIAEYDKFENVLTNEESTSAFRSSETEILFASNLLFKRKNGYVFDGDDFVSAVTCR